MKAEVSYSEITSPFQQHVGQCRVCQVYGTKYCAEGQELLRSVLAGEAIAREDFVNWKRFEKEM